MAVGLGMSIMAWAGSATAAGVVAGTAVASTMMSVVAGAIGGALIGAAIGGISAAVMGGDIGKGILFGAVGGLVTGGIAGYFSAGTTAVTGQVAGGSSGTSISISPTIAIKEGSFSVAEAASTVTTPTGGGGGSMLTGMLKETGKAALEGVGSEAVKLAGQAMKGSAMEDLEAKKAAYQEKADLQKMQTVREQLASAEKQARIGAGASVTSSEIGAGASKYGSDRALEGTLAGIAENRRQYDTARADTKAQRTKASTALEKMRLARQGVGGGEEVSGGIEAQVRAGSPTQELYEGVLNVPEEILNA